MTIQEMDIITLENNEQYIVIKEMSNYSFPCFFVANTKDTNDRKFITIDNDSATTIEDKELLDILYNDFCKDENEVETLINKTIKLIEDNI